MRNLNICKIGLISLLLGLSSLASAATEMQLSQDVDFGSLDPTNRVADYQHAVDFCLPIQAGMEHTYQVQASMLGSSQFVLHNATHFLPVELYWNNSPTVNGDQQLQPQTRLTVSNNVAPGADPSCVNGNMVNLNVIIRGHNLYAATAGEYSGVVNLTISATA